MSRIDCTLPSFSMGVVVVAVNTTSAPDHTTRVCPYSQQVMLVSNIYNIYCETRVRAGYRPAFCVLNKEHVDRIEHHNCAYRQLDRHSYVEKFAAKPFN